MSAYYFIYPWSFFHIFRLFTVLKYCYFHLTQMIWKRFMKIKALAVLLKADDKETWRIFRKIQALCFYPPHEVEAALNKLKRDPSMIAATPILRHLEEYYVRDGAQFAVEAWNHYDSIMQLKNRTTNNCESFHSHINRVMHKGVQFFFIINKI